MSEEFFGLLVILSPVLALFVWHCYCWLSRGWDSEDDLIWVLLYLLTFLVLVGSFPYGAA